MFNSSARYMGHMLNDYWAERPHLLNDHLRVLIKFREKNFAMIGDIKKIYRTVKIKTIEQHTHRFLCRDMDTGRTPDTHVIHLKSHLGTSPQGRSLLLHCEKQQKWERINIPKRLRLSKKARTRMT